MAVLKFYNSSTGQWEAISAGDQGAVEVKPQPPPTTPGIELWVDPQDFQGDSGWQGFDARFVNASGDTMTGTLYLVPVNPTDPDLRGEIEAHASGGLTLISRDSAGTRKIGLAIVPGSVGAWESFTTLEGYKAYNGFGGGLVFEVPKNGVPTAATHAATKGYVDGKIPTATVSSSAPANPIVGQLWATP